MIHRAALLACSGILLLTTDATPGWDWPIIVAGFLTVLAFGPSPRNTDARGTTTYWFMGEQITRHDYDALRAMGLPAREVSGRA